jgi:hypothetical protein
MKHATLIVAAAVVMGSTGSNANPGAPDLGWLAGHWCSEEGDRRVDEVWLAGAGGSMHGLSRTLAGGKVESFEYMRVEADAGKTSFLAQPNGATPTAFELAEHGAQHASFANPAHDFPNRIEYRREGKQLHAKISGPGQDGPMEIPFDYRLCD